MEQDCKWSELPPELSARIAGFLRPNELACTLRLVNRAAAAQFRGPQHTTVRLTQPVPPHAFARHWGAPGATRQLSYNQRVRLLCLTAASGSVPNMEVALEAGGCSPTANVFQAAAATGQLAMCEWLRQRGCSRYESLEAAAKAGQRNMVEWLVIGQENSSSGQEVLEAAARGGHVGLMEWLMRTHPDRFSLPADQGDRAWLLVAVAKGCDLATLQRLHREWLGAAQEGGGGQQQQQGLSVSRRRDVVTAAACSPTPDWRPKVEWLEGLGYPRTHCASEAAAACPDAEERLAWLRQRGYPVDSDAAEAAAVTGNLAALQYLHAEGVELNNTLTRLAALEGHLAVVTWLVEAPGVEAQLNEGLFNEAAESGSLELLMWLRERGCPWGENIFNSAVKGGNEAALEWLAERGCPIGANGEPYSTVFCHNDSATLRCLSRLGCPWGQPGEVFSNALRAVMAGFCKPHTLRMLLEVSCPVDWQAAESVVARDGWKECIKREVVEMLAEWRVRRGC